MQFPPQRIRMTRHFAGECEVFCRDHAYTVSADEAERQIRGGNAVAVPAVPDAPAAAPAAAPATPASDPDPIDAEADKAAKPRKSRGGGQG